MGQGFEKLVFLNKRSGDTQLYLNSAAAALSWFGCRTTPPAPAERLNPLEARRPPPR
jgi:hypothetical protein